MKNIKKNIYKNSSLKFIFNEDYKYTKTHSGFTYMDNKGIINLPHPNLLGDFQLATVSTAIAITRNLSQFKISETHIKKSIINIKSEARLQNITHGKLREYVSKDNQIILDGAHNPHAAKQLAVERNNWKRQEMGVNWVLGIQSHKQAPRMLRYLLKPSDKAWIVPIPNHTSWTKHVESLPPLKPIIHGLLSLRYTVLISS